MDTLTCVTAFYNIGREQVDGRSLQDYKQWLLQTVRSVEAPFVIFLDNTLGWKEDLLKATKGDRLHIVETPLAEVPLYPYKERIRAVLEHQKFKKHPQDITNQLPEYCMIQYSKFGWLEQAILKNPFKTNQFAWMDAGLSRFFNPSQVYEVHPISVKSFTLQADMKHPLLPTLTCDSYIGTNECIFKGTLWITDPYSFKRVQTEVMRILFEEMLQKNRLDNEQIALALAYKSIPDAFTCINPTEQIQPFFTTAFKKQEVTNESRSADVGIIEKKEKAKAKAKAKTTVVTCYYRIPSKHSHTNYEAWIENFMKLDMNVVVFGNTESITFLKQHYPATPSRIYKQREFRDFTSATFDWSHDEQRNREPKGGHSAQLFQIWSEKLHFVADVIAVNPFHSESFVWMDIGCVRTSAILPRMKGFPNLHGDLDRVQILQMKPWISDDMEKAKIVNHTQFLNRPTMGGTMWGGGPKALLAFRDQYMDILREADRLEVFKGEDQDMYAYCVLRNPELFKIHRPLENDYDEWFSLHLLWSDAPPLRIVLVGPGLMPIPPTGWGACEILIWDMAVCLKKQGHEVTILNTKDMSRILSHVQQQRPDFVHIQYDDYAYMAPLLSPYAKAIAITSHYGYLDQPGRWGPYANTFRCCIGHTDPNIYHFALSDSIRQIYLKHGANANQVFVTPNGADETLFRYTETPAYPERSIVVGKMEVRKGQYRLMNTENVWFAGNKSDGSFDYRHPRWLGEWTKPVLYNSLTDYGNLVLLSDGEADPLVVKEALVAGLGVVVSTWAAANLDKHPFLTVIEASKLDDAAYIAQKIKENREYSVKHRKEIKEYSRNHTWTHRTTEYATLVRSIVNPFKISLCIPTMKRWSFLKDTLPKYLENPIIDEIVITDETGEDAEQIATHLKSPKLKVHVNGTCLGAFLNKRKAVALAINDFVCLMDSDNYAPPSYFEAFRQYVKGAPDPSTVYCPGRWNPLPGNSGMDFTAFQNVPITDANRKDLFPLGLESFFNDGNYIVSKDLYNKAEATGSFKQYESNCLAADVIFQNHLLFQQGATLVIVPGMSYDHAVHEGSYWKTTSDKFDYSVFQNMYK